MARPAAPHASTASSNAGSLPWQFTAALFLLPATGLYLLFVLWPLAQVVRLSLYRWSGYGTRTFIGLSNFQTLAADPIFHLSLEHTAVWEIAALTIPTLIALGVALILWHGRSPSLLLAILFFPVLLPPTVVAATWTILYSPASGPPAALGLQSPDWLGDPHLALGSIFVAWLWSILGIGVLIFWAALLGIRREEIELALVEGAGPIWRFQHIVLPGIRRTVWLVLAINAALAIQVFDLVFVTTGGGPGYATMLLSLEINGRGFGGRAGQGAAAACLQVALALVLGAAVALGMRQSGESSAGESLRFRGSVRRDVAAVPVAAAIVLPLAWLFLIAVQPARLFIIRGPTLSPAAWGWGNFVSAWDAGLASALVMSLGLAAAVVGGTLLLAVPAAFALAHPRTHRAPRYGAAALLMVGMFQPTSALLLPLFDLLNRTGLLGTAWGIILPEIARSLPFAILVLWGFFSATQRSLLEAAEVDGAGPLRQLRSVVLPLARPALLAVTIWSFVISWNEYLLPVVVAQNSPMQTVPTLLGSFIGRYNTELGLLAAGSLIAAAPALLIYLLLRRSAGTALARAESSLR